MRAPPTTFESIESIALREPGRLALVEGDDAYTYGELHLNLVRFTRVLQALGVQRGQRVAASRPSLHVQLLLLLACENLGAVTAPFIGQDDPDAQALFAQVDWVFSERPQACPAGVRLQPIDDAFIDHVARIDPHDPSPHPRVALELSDPQRIARTSGSSGRSKLMLLSRQSQETWIRTGTDNGGYTSETRLLLQGPLVVNSFFTRSCACLRLGAAVVSVETHRLPATRFTHLWSLPMRLAELLDELPPGYVAPGIVQVGTSGGFIAQPLRQRVLRVFGTRVRSRYGANEVGGICDDLDDAGEGWLSPGVDVRILDADGQELPMGQTGRIALRTPALVNGYLGDPEATRAAFHGGWFHSGDLGALVDPRRLKLWGRHDDLLNLGGHKVPATIIEAKVRELVAVRDCAALAIHLAAGAIQVGLALAVDPDTPRAPLARRLEESLVLGGNTSARLLFMDELPRLQGGKLDRVALHRLFAERAGADTGGSISE